LTKLNYFNRPDKPHEECGIVGVYNTKKNVAKDLFFGLFSLQHRGQESAGIATSSGFGIKLEANMGLVSQVFNEENISKLSGGIGIGHTRYSTMGGSKKNNAQPLITSGIRGEIAIGHNGNVINASELREELSIEFGSKFERSSDTEVILEMFANAPGKNWFEISSYVMRRLKGAYSLVIMNDNELIAVRDPLGIRPLCLGKLDDGWVVASESSALDNLGADFIREIENGETLVINSEGVKSKIWNGSSKNHKMCIFEHIYFARPDSILNGELAYETRFRLGSELFKEHPVEADIVVGIPDSSTPHAAGLAAASKIPYSDAIIRNRYVGRTFINPDQSSRDTNVANKFNPMKEIISGKRLIVVDDSIVRSTTIKKVISMLRKAGAKEIHVRVASPPIKSTCHFGVDMATLSQLIAANKTNDEIRDLINADSLAYLSVEGLEKATKSKKSEYCKGCFTGKYPIPVQLEMDKLTLEKEMKI
tara:strand:- start:7063 stop:8499 length:1437 start_codon:yes stop_codon:yes gene_type:complete